MILTASIVLYKNDESIVQKAIDSFLGATDNAILYLIDNSPTDVLKKLANNPRIRYTFNNRNVGFGAGHNSCLKTILATSQYHLVLNPDVYFNSEVISELQRFMDAHKNIGLVMPKVLYPDGRLQPLCKLLPSPKTLIVRRFLRAFTKLVERENHVYELRSFGYDRIVDVPFLSGCFMFLRVDALRKSGLFDERFFLYVEDTDLTRRIHKYYRTVYYPDVTIYHYHEKGSYKNFWLLLCGTWSAVKYFNKWGWRRDTEREVINRKILLQFQYLPS